MHARRNFNRNDIALVSLGTGVAPIFGQGVSLANADSSAMPDHALVVVQLAGGNDGLNMVVPATDPVYKKLRPTLAIAPDKVLPLDTSNTFGLHPSMGGVKKLYDQNMVAVVNGVGYVNPNYSHFAAMAIWQTGNLNGIGEGWVGKYFDSVADQNDPFVGVNIGGGNPREFSSKEPPVPSIENFATYGVKPGPGTEAQNQRRDVHTLAMYDALPGTAQFGALLQGTIDDAFTTAVRVKQIGSYKPTVTYPQSALGGGLQMIAAALTANLGVRVAHVTLGGFDTHSAEAGTQAQLLQDLSDSLAAFYADLGAQGKAQNTITMTWSEFGRRVGENASRGTDHGSAEPVLVIGGSVKGGLYGGVSLANLIDDGNLQYQVDFRSVYATLLDKWLQADADTLLGAHFDRVGFL